ncbi:hypothetical protein MAHJHV63_54720 [Mycobacterium avium subsp. hominissuis]
MAENTIKWDKDADGIVTLTLDDPTGSANVMNEHYKESMHNAVERLVAEKDSITGVVIESFSATRRSTPSRRSSATCARWRRSASRWWPPSTACRASPARAGRA